MQDVRFVVHDQDAERLRLAGRTGAASGARGARADRQLQS